MTSLMELAQRTKASLREQRAAEFDAAREEQLVILHSASMALALDLKTAIQAGELETRCSPRTQKGVDIKDVGGKTVAHSDGAAFERELTKRLGEPELEVVLFFGMTHLVVRLRGWP